VSERDERLLERDEGEEAVDQNRFDPLAHAVGGVPSRRAILRHVAGVGFGLGSAGLPIVAATKRQRKAKRRNAKIELNAYGCVNVGDFCRNAGQCCSGLCKGKKRRKRCRAHDSEGCEAGATSGLCAVGLQDVACTTSRGAPGICYTTTGNAGICAVAHGDARLCRECAEDVECQALFGPGAACVPCPGDCPATGTRCVTPDPNPPGL
jgi:hypothetical protein